MRIVLAIFALVVVSIITVWYNWSMDRSAQLLVFCTQEYDAHATLDAANTYFGDPIQCLNQMSRSIRTGSY